MQNGISDFCVQVAESLNGCRKWTFSNILQYLQYYCNILQQYLSCTGAEKTMHPPSFTLAQTQMRM